MDNNSKFIPAYWRPETHPVANQKNIVQGKKYRFTVLSSGLIRCEFQPEGMFEDRASQIIWHRNFPESEYTVTRSRGNLQIKTDKMTLTYKEGRSFSAFTLSAIIKSTGYKWRYGSRDRGNLRGTRRTLDMTNGRAPLAKGLLSRNGSVWMDDSSSLIMENDWPVPRPPEAIDAYLLANGQDYKATLKDWFALTGKTPLVPRAILGNWWSRYWEYSEESLKDLINRFESEEIPLSVCIIDMDWHLVHIPKKYGSGWTGYTWNRELFPDPPGMLKWLTDRKLLNSLNLHPARGIRGHEEAYPETAKFMGIDPASDKTIEFDATDPRFMRAYFDKVHHPMEDEGVNFWWIDWQQGKKSSMKGLDPLWMLNHLHFLDSGRGGKRPFTFSRYSGPGAHRYPLGFSGDSFSSWATLKFQPELTATASNIGYGWWSHDIGGHYYGSADSELYARWVQQGVFSPIMRLHSTKKAMNRREPWRHSPEAASTATDFMRLRHRLIPYIYSAARQDHLAGEALVRPLYHEEPENPHSYKFPTEYHFGSELLIAPVVEKASRRVRKARCRFYLPEGTWYDVSSGRRYSGDRIRSRYYATNEFPVFARAGAIIPLADYKELNETGNPEALTVEVFPGANGCYKLYEDDGVSQGYLKGEGSETNFNLSWQKDEMKLEVQLPKAASYLPKKRNLELHFRNIRPDVSLAVSINGKTLETDDVSGNATGDRPGIYFRSYTTKTWSLFNGPALKVLVNKLTPGTLLQVIATLPPTADKNVAVGQSLEDDCFDDKYFADRRASDILDTARGFNHQKSHWWKSLESKTTPGVKRRFLRYRLNIPAKLRRALREQFDNQGDKNDS